jgi:hypothetical protein
MSHSKSMALVPVESAVEDGREQGVQLGGGLSESSYAAEAACRGTCDQGIAILDNSLCFDLRRSVGSETHQCRKIPVLLHMLGLY